MGSAVILPAARLLKGAAGTISHQFYDSDGEESSPPAGVLAATATRSDGSAVVIGAPAGTGDAPRTVSIGVAELLTVDRITVTWTLDGDPLWIDEVDVIGGTLGSVAQLKATDKTLRQTDTEVILAKRRVVEDMALSVLGRSPFERFHVERVNGSGTSQLLLSFPDLLEVVWARELSSGSTYRTLGASELATIPPDEAGIATRSDFGVWPVGWRNIEVGYRFGMVPCPGDLLEALRKSIRHAITGFDTGVPAFATSMQTADGFNFGLASPGNDKWATGDISIDRVVNRYKIDAPSIGAA